MGWQLDHENGQKEVTFYMSPNGSDSNPGTLKKPLATLTGARNAIRSLKSQNNVTDTIRVLIKGGRYFMQEPLKLIAQDGGTKKYPVIYEAASDSLPQFIGGKIITGFEVGKDGVWRTKIPETVYYDWQFDQLYVNEKRASIAKDPNKGFLNIVDVHQDIWKRGKGRVPKRAQQVIHFSEDQFSNLKKIKKEEGHNVRFRAYHNWEIMIRFLDNINTDSLSISISGKGMTPWNPLKRGTRITFENYKSALDTPGEWFLSKDGILSYYPKKNETPQNSEVIAPALPYFISAEGEAEKGEIIKNIQFKNIKFSYSHYKIPREGYEPYQAAVSIDAAIKLEGVQDFVIENCEISHTGQHAISFSRGSRDSRVEHCYLYDLGGGGVYIGDSDSTYSKQKPTTGEIQVYNNIVQTGGREFESAVGIWIGHSANNRITHNDIGDFFYTGVSVGWHWGYDYSPATNNKVLYNHIHHIGWGLLSDMGGVYTLGPSKGTEVSNNVIHDIYSYSYGGWGLYTDEGSSNIKMENNLVYRTKSGGFHQHYGKNNIIRNNIFAFSKVNQLQVTRVEDHKSFEFSNNIVVYDSGKLMAGPWDKININMDNNLYWKIAEDPIKFGNKNFVNWKREGKDQRSLITNPKFKDLKNNNYNFTEDAPFHEIGFQPFYYDSAGVLGGKNWQMKAELSEEKKASFKDLN